MGDKLNKAARRLYEFFQNIVSIFERLLNLPPRFGARPDEKGQHAYGQRRKQRPSLDEFALEIEQLFTGHLTTKNMIAMSKQIQTQVNTCAKTSPSCMLPSFNHALPVGDEKGTYLALDVGGSTFRVALVELSGSNGAMKIIRMASSVIDEEVKALEGKAFFDWMAQKIDEMLDRGTEGYASSPIPLRMGLSWSFPIDQTSIRSGRVISMGKGFHCSDGTTGDDLSELIMEACSKRNMNVRMEAIVNDGSATLLSRAYTDSSTRMSLILGTGTNVAIHYPVHAIGMEKFGDRSPQWFEEASHVIVNTELSMFGGEGVLTMTRWDDYLNRNHMKPDYQPLEYMITGRYLGEIVRLIIAEAVDVAGLFNGKLPASMSTPYSFDTSIVACIEEDSSPSLQTSSSFIQKHHEFTVPPTPSDLLFVQKVCKSVSRRAAAYLATAIHSLWCLRNESETPLPPSTPEFTSKKDDAGLETLKIPTEIVTQKTTDLDVTIACDGSVINKYPNFRPQCQEYLNQLTLPNENSAPLSPVDSDDTAQAKLCSKPLVSSISLDPAPESAIFGAAVAVAIAVPPN